jgi:hypothetical protein
MPYIKKTALVRSSRRRPMMGFGDFNDESLCSTIPSGDPYRKPGNYCNTGDGGYTTFNADGTVYQVPSTTTTAAPSGPSTVSKILSALFPSTPATPTMPVATGMSTTTKIAIAGGAVLLAVVILRR